MQSGRDVARAADLNTWADDRRRRRRGPWLAALAAAVVIAGLVAYHVTASQHGPIALNQVTDSYAELSGIYAGDGVTINLQDLGGMPSFSYQYAGSPVYGIPSWAAPFGRSNGEGSWLITHLPGSQDAAIELELDEPLVQGTPVKPGPSIVLALIGTPASPTMACQHPDPGTSCTLPRTLH